mmetsp:Transcript_26684/g.57215  ORF Transcript_26684/g.57215 Transcript_26684/m.57215 type:complete len:256 (-) Transcript_26684:2869-3636(-)
MRRQDRSEGHPDKRKGRLRADTSTVQGNQILRRRCLSGSLFLLPNRKQGKVCQGRQTGSRHCLRIGAGGIRHAARDMREDRLVVPQGEANLFEAARRSQARGHPLPPELLWGGTATDRWTARRAKKDRRQAALGRNPSHGVQDSLRAPKRSQGEVGPYRQPDRGERDIRRADPAIGNRYHERDDPDGRRRLQHGPFLLFGGLRTARPDERKGPGDQEPQVHDALSHPRFVDKDPEAVGQGCHRDRQDGIRRRPRH